MFEHSFNWKLGLAFVAALSLLACNGETPDVDGGVDANISDADGAAPNSIDSFCTTPLPDMSPASDGCPVSLPEDEDLLDEALAKHNLGRCDIVYIDSNFAGFIEEVRDDPYRLSFFDRTHRAALNVPLFVDGVTSVLDTAAANEKPVTSALMVASHYAGHGGEVCLPPIEVAENDPLATAIIDLIEDNGGIANADEIKSAATEISDEFQKALVPIIYAISEAALARELAFKDADLGKTETSPGIDLETLYKYAASMTIRSKDNKALAPTEEWVQNLLKGQDKGFQYQVLYQAAVRLAAAIEGAGLSSFVGVTASLNIDTPIGRIIISGPDADTYLPSDSDIGQSIALLIDTGGKDTYKIPAGATSSANNPVSVLIDLDGEDTYGYEEVPSSYDEDRIVSDSDGRRPGGDPATGNTSTSMSGFSRQGAGRLGIGFLFDFGKKKDAYTSLRMSQGFGSFGVGVLYDDGGDDVYRGESGVQGAGIFGIGLLLDMDGNDTYETYNQSQGFGYVKSVGILYDKKGGDQYLADVGDPTQGGDPLYLSAQLPGKGNNSFVQGAGLGRRASSDTVYMSGGLGVIRDLAGKDVYTASVFGQGTGYWFGTGILADGGNDDDTYDGLWYVQGATAHFAMSAFVEDGGNDKYNSAINPNSTAIGVGHDFSVSWHLDKGGDDDYRGPILSLGSGNDNGIGIMVNIGGKDKYLAKAKKAFGAAPLSEGSSNFRKNILTLGVFIDTEGQDSYTVAGTQESRDNTSWLYESTNTDTTKEWGVGLDNSGTVVLP